MYKKNLLIISIIAVSSPIIPLSADTRYSFENDQEYYQRCKKEEAQQRRQAQKEEVNMNTTGKGPIFTYAHEKDIITKVGLIGTVLVLLAWLLGSKLPGNKSNKDKA